MKRKMTAYQEYIHCSRYARWVDGENRRESWGETVDRYVSFFVKRFPNYPAEMVSESIFNMDVMPSMRAFMTARPCSIQR